MDKSLIHRSITVFSVIAGGALLLLGAFQFRSILLLAFVSLILASALYPAVEMGKKIKIPALVTIFTCYTVLFVFISLLLSFVIPPLLQQTMQLANTASHTLGLNELRLDGMLVLDVNQIAQSVTQYGSLMNQFTGSLRTALSVISSTFSLMFILVTWLVLATHMLLSLPHVTMSISWLMPGETKQEKWQQANTLVKNVMLQLGGWVRGQVFLMVIIGVVTYIGLLLLGVPYALPLAILAGLFEIVPNLGPTISAIPGIIAAFLLVNPVTGIFTVIFYVLVQQFENNFIVPQVMKGAVDVHPLTTIVLMLIGFQAMGVIGAIVVLPVYITLRTAMRQLYPNWGPFADFSQIVAKK